ncbi:methyltransferase domain-containing protein [bacterium]|nr:methyltransferase domain-containing protein [bacterium]
MREYILSESCTNTSLGRVWKKIGKGLGFVQERLHVPCQMPQAVMDDRSYERVVPLDWRSHFTNKLSGCGLEIGPLHRPMPTHAGMQMDYIDRLTVKEMREHYAELRDFDLVEPTIIGDAETLQPVENAKYDFLIAAHVIEHMRNPIQALQHWHRVVKPGGLIYLVVPDKRMNFDAKRVRTTLEHLILDYQAPSLERDFEHYVDYANFVEDLSREKAIAKAHDLVKIDYSIHYHVFLPQDLVSLVQWIDLNVCRLSVCEGPCAAEACDEFHILLRVGS